MDRSWWYRAGLIAVVTLGSIWYLVPSYYSFAVLPREKRNDLKALEQALPRWAPSAKERLSLGLDLQGGIHMIMRVDTRTGLEKRTERRGAQIAKHLQDKKLGEVSVDADPERLQLTLKPKDPKLLDAIAKEVQDYFGNDFSKASQTADAVTYQLRDVQQQNFRQEALNQAIDVISRRVNKWGVAEVEVRTLGTDSIQISLPGHQDTEQAKELIGTTAQLEFRMVDDESTFFKDYYAKNPPPPESGITLTGTQLKGPDREALLSYVKPGVPADRQVLLECKANANKKGVCDSYTTYLVEKKVSLTGESISLARFMIGQYNEPEVQVNFDNAGAKEFGELTTRGVKKRMAIVLDDDVVSAPTINEPITGGTARITLGRSIDKTNEDRNKEASLLATQLNAGALPAPVTIGEVRQVGASLGDELIKKGSLAAVVGLLLVVAFMALYYKKTGLIADVALILNGLLILAGLALLQATLTLPGIAGFVLTLGIAVDANVLINERIREELANGKSARAAVDQGYDRAFWTIFDAHVTTLLAGGILFATGTGPVRGFATSLIIGLIASLFTSIVVTRAITTFFVHGRNAQTVSV